MDQKSIDAGSPRRPEGVAQHLMRLFEIDIAHHFEVAVQIAVADGGDDDIPDLAMIHAGNLLRWFRNHAGGPCCDGGIFKFDQASTDLRKSSMQSASRSGVCPAI